MLPYRALSSGLRLLTSSSTSLSSSLSSSLCGVNLPPAALFHQSAVVLSEPGPSYKGRRMWFRPWQRGFWVREGERAEIGAKLVCQVNLHYHPGEHVGIMKDKTLYALEAGRVFVTSEIVEPNWKNEIIQEAYAGRKGHMMFKHFVHIAPDTIPQKFKLVSNI